MKLIEQSFIIIDSIDGQAILEKLERCGRVCYKSESKITEGSAATFVHNIIKRGHESVLEHVSITVKFITDRGISHEIVRHRIASYSQESTRYVKLDGEMEFIKPLDMTQLQETAFNLACEEAEWRYHQMLRFKAAPQMARDVLSNALKTELVMTANLREWRHFFRLRTAPGAHPKMRVLAGSLLKEFKYRIPVVFDDIEV